MKYLKQLFSTALFSLAVVGVSLLQPAITFAAASSLSIEPASGSVNQHNSIQLAIYETGDNVQAVTARLNYDATKFFCSGIGSGAFGGEVTASCGGGSATISRYITPGTASLQGRQLVGTITFKALTAGGNTSVTFGSSQVASAGINTLASTSGGTYSLLAPIAADQTPAPAPTTPPRATNRAVTPAPTSGSAAQTTPATHTDGETENAKKEVDATKPKAAENASTTANKRNNETVSKRWVVPASIGLLLALAAGTAGVLVRRRQAAKAAAVATAAALAAKKTKKSPAKKKSVKKTVPSRKK